MSFLSLPCVCLLVCVVLYFLGRYVLPVREFVSFVCDLARIPFVKLEQYLSPFKGKADKERPGLATILRVLLFFVALIGCAAETYGGIQSADALWGGDVSGGTVLPPAFAPLALGVLLLCLATIFGMLWLENKQYIPKQAAAFALDENKATAFKRLSFWCLVLSILANIVSYAGRKFYLLNPDSVATGITQLVAFLLLGALVPLMGMFAWYLLAIGLEALISLLLGVVYFLASLVGDICWLLSSSFARMGKNDAGSGNTQQVTTKQNHSTFTFPSVPTQESEADSMTDASYVTVTAHDVLGDQLSPYIQGYFSQSKPLVRCSGRMVSRLGKRKPLGLGVDVSAISYTLMEDKIVDAYSTAHDLRSLHLHILDRHSSPNAFQMLRDIKRRMPKSTHIAITELASYRANGDDQVFLSELAKLFHERVLATTMLLNSSSGLYRLFGEIKVHEHIARLLADLVVAPTHSFNNLSGFDVFTQLDSAFVSIAVASAPVSSGKTPLRWSWLKLFTKKAVIVNLDDLLAQSLAVTKQVIEEPDVRAWDQPIDRVSPCRVVTDTPVRLDDRYFHRFEQRNTQQVRYSFPNVQSLTISGQPISPLRGSSTPFRIGCTCLFPVTLSLPAQETPQPTKKADVGKEETRSSVVPADTVVVIAPTADAAASNGHKNGRGRRPSRAKKEK